MFMGDELLASIALTAEGGADELDPLQQLPPLAPLPTTTHSPLDPFATTDVAVGDVTDCGGGTEATPT